MLVLYNSNAGSAAEADIEALRSVPGVDLVDCEDPDDTIDAAAEAAHSGIDLVVAAGGDGTVHLVANGLMRAGPTADTRPALGVLPLGTGNDLARTLALPLKVSPIEALDALRHAERRCLDLIRVSHDGDDDHTDYAINVCAGGFSGAVDEVLTSELKATWGPLAYLVGAVKAMPDLDAYDTQFAWDGGPAERIAAYNVVVANARTAGGGKPVAPRANPEDGLLDVVVVRAQADIARLAARVLAGDYLDDEDIVFNRVSELYVESTPGMWFNVDGELRTNVPVTFKAVPQALRVCVGPKYVRDVEVPS
ncbi:diacylglycerol/lipid kinase family protein [Rubrivirga marina]|nr:diacylglycerol kinase family protein [Rubrivirga marina]